jgi:hypothetical protein
VKLQRKGCARYRFQSSKNPRSAARSSATEGKSPCRKHCRCTMLKNSSIWFTHDACLGV